MRANAWEGIGKELKIKFYVSSRYVRIVCPRLNPLNAELNPICRLLVLLGAHSILHVSRIRVKVICNVMACSSDDTHQRFGGNCCFHLHSITVATLRGTSYS